jgi:hypothetical protein
MMTKPQLLTYSNRLLTARDELAKTLNSLAATPEFMFGLVVRSSPMGLNCTYANKTLRMHEEQPFTDQQLLTKIIEISTKALNDLALNNTQDQQEQDV